MNEYFASSADVYRILGTLPDGADKMATADGREKTVAASCARLARMVGREADRRTLASGPRSRAGSRKRRPATSATPRSCACPSATSPKTPRSITAGVGEAIAVEVARRLGRPSRTFSDLVGGGPGASHCAPAAAVALLAALVEPAVGFPRGLARPGRAIIAQRSGSETCEGFRERS